MLATMVEATTGVCSALDQVRHQLTRARHRLARAAARERAQLTTTVPRGSTTARSIGPDAHYHRIHRLYGDVMTEAENCGCHVHVGTLDFSAAIVASNHLRAWLPTLLALSTAPHSDGTTGYASWRTIATSRCPTVQIPPHFTSPAHYHDVLESLQRNGVLLPGTNAFWLARPSTHLPTIEVRVADVTDTVDQAVLQAALCRALVHTALEAHADGRPPPAVTDQQAAAALWTVARYGLNGPAVHPFGGHRVAATALAAELLTHLRPALRSIGDEDETEELFHRTLTGRIRSR
jgi:carboxylate-amine ligase